MPIGMVYVVKSVVRVSSPMAIAQVMVIIHIRSMVINWDLHIIHWM